MLEKETFEWVVNFIIYPSCAIFANICLYVIANSLEK